MKPYVLTITLNPAIDKFVLLPEFSLGSDFRAKDVFCSPGGKGINVSRVLKALGIPALASGFLAGSSGRYIRYGLDQEKLPNNFCFIPGETRTNTTIIDQRSGTATRVLEPGPQVDRRHLRAFLARFDLLLKGCRLVVFSGSLSPGIPDSFYATLISKALKQKKPSILDTSGVPLKLGAAAGPFMLKPNIQEVRHLLGRPVTLSRIPVALRRLYQKLNSDIVSITCGSDGAMIFDGHEMFLGAPVKSRHKNVVGCGDAFIAGFIASFLRKKCLRDSFRSAIACATAHMFQLTPGCLKIADMRRLSKKVRIIPLGLVTPYHKKHHQHTHA